MRVRASTLAGGKSGGGSGEHRIASAGTNWTRMRQPNVPSTDRAIQQVGQQVHWPTRSVGSVRPTSGSLPRFVRAENRDVLFVEREVKMNNPVRELTFRFSDEGGDDSRLRCSNDRKVIMSSKAVAKRKSKIGRSGMKPYMCRNGFWHVGHKDPAKQRGITGN